jgi:hypothetical protein
VGYPESFPGLEDEEPLKLAEKSFFGNAVPNTRPAYMPCVFDQFWLFFLPVSTSFAGFHEC